MMPSSVLFILLSLCSLQLTVVTSPICQMYGKVVTNAHQFLKDVAGPFPVHCLQYNTNISFPDSAIPAARASHSECRQSLGVLYETLRGAEILFEEYDLPVGEAGFSWDEQKLDIFLNLQNRLVTESRCLSNVNASSAISSYFSNVTAVIENQDSAACGWMAMRRDLLWVMKSTLHKHRNCFSWRHERHLG